MSEFHTERQLPAAHVTVNTVDRIHLLLLKHLQLAAQYAHRDDLIQSSSISVKDAFGEEKFSSIADMPGTRFPASTSEIKISAAIGGTNAVSVDVVYSSSRDESRCRVRVRGSNARARGTRIADAVISISREQWTMGKYVGYPTAAIVFAISIAISIVVGNIVSDELGTAVLTRGLILTAIIGGARYLWPYTEFDSPRIDVLRHGRKVISWIAATSAAAWITFLIQPYL